jgi:hypothetical protein
MNSNTKTQTGDDPHRLLARLTELGELVQREFLHVNHGGCCVYAALVADKLQSLKPQTHPGIKIFGDNNGGVAEDFCIEGWLKNYPRASLKDWVASGLEVHHAVLQVSFGGRLWYADCDGVTQNLCSFRRGYPIYKGTLPVKVALEFALRGDTAHFWNEAFNRCQIPRMRHIIDDFFKDNGLTKAAPAP